MMPSDLVAYRDKLLAEVAILDKEIERQGLNVKQDFTAVVEEEMTPVSTPIEELKPEPVKEATAPKKVVKKVVKKGGRPKGSKNKTK